MVHRRAKRTSGFAGQAMLAVGLLVGACSTARPPSDPGRLEVWNQLRDGLAVIVGGRMYQIPPCQVSVFEDAELRGVILATPNGLQLAAFPSDRNTTAIGPRRYLLVGYESFGEPARIMDLRTRPVFPRPARGDCTLSIADVLRDGPNP